MCIQCARTTVLGQEQDAQDPLCRGTLTDMQQQMWNEGLVEGMTRLPPVRSSIPLKIQTAHHKLDIKHYLPLDTQHQNRHFERTLFDIRRKFAPGRKFAGLSSLQYR